MVSLLPDFINPRGWIMKKNISLEEAQGLIMEHCSPPKTEDVALQDSLGRVLAKDIKA
jgi:molybdopterin biosynthesis enzyme